MIELRREDSIGSDIVDEMAAMIGGGGLSFTRGGH